MAKKTISDMEKEMKLLKEKIANEQEKIVSTFGEKVMKSAGFSFDDLQDQKKISEISKFIKANFSKDEKDSLEENSSTSENI